MLYVKSLAVGCGAPAALKPVPDEPGPLRHRSAELVTRRSRKNGRLRGSRGQIAKTCQKCSITAQCSCRPSDVCRISESLAGTEVTGISPASVPLMAKTIFFFYYVFIKWKKLFTKLSACTILQLAFVDLTARCVIAQVLQRCVQPIKRAHTERQGTLDDANRTITRRTVCT